jgi:sugar/nucleoside kinase (ribokinase family)
LDSLQKEGVDTGGVIKRAGGHSQFAFVFAEPRRRGGPFSGSVPQALPWEPTS